MELRSYLIIGIRSLSCQTDRKNYLSYVNNRNKKMRFRSKSQLKNFLEPILALLYPRINCESGNSFLFQTPSSDLKCRDKWISAPGTISSGTSP